MKPSGAQHARLGGRATIPANPTSRYVAFLNSESIHSGGRLTLLNKW